MKKYFKFNIDEIKDQEIDFLEEGCYEGTITDVIDCPNTYMLKIQLEDEYVFLGHIPKKYPSQPRSFLFDVLSETEDMSSKHLFGLEVVFSVVDYNKKDGTVGSSLYDIVLTENYEEDFE